MKLIWPDTPQEGMHTIRVKPFGSSLAGQVLNGRRPAMVEVDVYELVDFILRYKSNGEERLKEYILGQLYPCLDMSGRLIVKEHIYTVHLVEGRAWKNVDWLLNHLKEDYLDD